MDLKEENPDAREDGNIPTFLLWMVLLREAPLSNASERRREGHGARILHYRDVICVTWALCGPPTSCRKPCRLCGFPGTDKSLSTGNLDPSWQIVGYLCQGLLRYPSSFQRSSGVCVCVCTYVHTCSMSPHTASALLKCKQFLNPSFPGLAGC